MLCRFRSSKLSKIVDQGPVVVPKKADSALSGLAVLPRNWKHGLVACGSNACNQLHVYGIILCLSFCNSDFVIFV